MIMDIATQMNLVNDHSYVQGHIDTIAELTSTIEDSTDPEGKDMLEPMPETDDDEEDEMLPPSARMMKNAAKAG
jgi:hypothetical protein